MVTRKRVLTAHLWQKWIPIEHFIANYDIGGLESFLNNLYHVLVKFEQKHMVQTTQLFEL